jgi:hypothetical protein
VPRHISTAEEFAAALMLDHNEQALHVGAAGRPAMPLPLATPNLYQPDVGPLGRSTRVTPEQRTDGIFRGITSFR